MFKSSSISGKYKSNSEHGASSAESIQSSRFSSSAPYASGTGTCVSVCFLSVFSLFFSRRRRRRPTGGGSGSCSAWFSTAGSVSKLARKIRWDRLRTACFVRPENSDAIFSHSFDPPFSCTNFSNFSSSSLVHRPVIFGFFGLDRSKTGLYSTPFFFNSRMIRFLHASSENPSTAPPMTKAIFLHFEPCTRNSSNNRSSVSCVWIDHTGRLRRSSAAAPSKFGIACAARTCRH